MKQGGLKIIGALALCLVLAAPAMAEQGLNFTGAFKLWIDNGATATLLPADYSAYGRGERQPEFLGAVQAADQYFPGRYGALSAQAAKLSLNVETNAGWGALFRNYVQLLSRMETYGDLRKFLLLTSETGQRCIAKAAGRDVSLAEATLFSLFQLSGADGGNLTELSFKWWVDKFFNPEATCGGISPANTQLFQAVQAGDLDGAMRIVRATDADGAVYLQLYNYANSQLAQ